MVIVRPTRFSKAGSSPAMSETAPSEVAGALCLGCGLCCDGGFHAHVDLDREDRAALAAIGEPAPDRLDHPCRYFADGPCAIYAVRPAACRAYRCRVLKALDRGEIDPPTARARVAEALALRARMRESLPPGMTIAQAAAEWGARGRGSPTPENARAMLAYVAYWAFAERHFVKRNDPRIGRDKLSPR